MLETIEISIIGGGASGISFLWQLINKIKNHPHKNHFSIKLFEKRNSLGTGLAYSAKSHFLLLNSPAGMFSIDPEDPKHFFKWLMQHQEKWRHEFPEIGKINENSFLPRRLAGFYIKDFSIKVKKIAEDNDILLDFVNSEVTNIINNDIYTEILTEDRKVYTSNYTVLCTGHLPSEKFKELEKCPGYFHSPYLDNEHKIKNTVLPDSTILILGTKLSAIDTAILLRENGHAGKITMASRQGVLPSVRSELKHYSLRYLNLETMKSQLYKNKNFLNIEDLLSAIQAEISNIYSMPISVNNILASNNLDAYLTLRIDLNRARRKKVFCEKIHVEFFDIFEEYWKYFSTKEKKKYFDKLFNLMQRYLIPFPISNAEKISEMIRNGCLSIKKGITNNIKFDKQKSIFIATFNTYGKKQKETFNYVINATGCGKSLRFSNDMLYLNLSNYGDIQFNLFGGLDVSTENFMVNTKNSYKSRIYAIGQPTHGAVCYTSMMNTIVKQIKIALEDILNDCSYSCKK